MTKPITIIALVVAYCIFLGCPFLLRPESPEVSSDRFGQDPEETLVVISPHWEGVKYEFENGFSKWRQKTHGTSVDIQWLNVGGGTSDILRYIRSEYKRISSKHGGEEAGIGVDVFYGGGIDSFVKVAEEGHCEAYVLPDKILEQIPPNFGGMPLYDEKYRWYGAALSGFGIIYNKIVLDRMKLIEPRTWLDLADPNLRTWFGSGDPGNSGSTHTMYEVILQVYGWERGFETIVKMGGNTRYFSKSGSQVPKDVSLGEVACGLCIDFYAGAQIAEVGSDRIGYVMPEGQTVINTDPIAILKGAPHRDLARSFLEFVLSEPGQKLWMLHKGAPGGPEKFDLCRLSVIPSLYEKCRDEMVVKSNPFLHEPSFRYDPQKGSARWGILNDFLRAAIIDNHKYLSAAWRAVINADMNAELLKELTAPPITEDELLLLAKEKWKDAEFRNNKRAEWVSMFRKRYRRIRREAVKVIGDQ